MSYKIVRNPSHLKNINYSGYAVAQKAVCAIPERLILTDLFDSYKRAGRLELIDDVSIEDKWDIGSCFNLDKIKSVMLTRHYAFGDVLFVTALIENIRIAYPNLEIYFNTAENCIPLIKDNPCCIPITSKTKYDILREVDLHIVLDDVMEHYEDSNKDKLNRIEILCKYVGVDYIDKIPAMYYMPDELESWGVFLASNTPPYTAICPSSLRKEKSLDDKSWQQIIDDIKEGTVFIFDSMDRGLKGDNVVTVIGYPIRDAVALASHMDNAVTLDSFWSHVMAMWGIPQVLITSCTDGVLLSKDYPNITNVFPDKDCYPCWYNLKKGGCSLGSHPLCFNQELVNKIKEVLHE